jgi:hypothetical protein
MSLVKKLISFFILCCIFILVESQQACRNVTTPHYKTDCYPYKDDSYSCCFANLTLPNNSTNTTCFPMDKRFEFAGQFLTQYDLGNGTYVNATVSCSTDPQKTCSTDSPHRLADCRFDGSHSTSCCMITDGTGHGNCILSKNFKFGNDTNYTIFNTTIQCSGSYFYLSKLLLIVFVLILAN